jgi:hypothetical protein
MTSNARTCVVTGRFSKNRRANGVVTAPRDDSDAFLGRFDYEQHLAGRAAFGSRSMATRATPVEFFVICQHAAAGEQERSSRRSEMTTRIDSLATGMVV